MGGCPLVGATRAGIFNGYSARRTFYINPRHPRMIPFGHRRHLQLAAAADVAANRTGFN